MLFRFLTVKQCQVENYNKLFKCPEIMSRTSKEPSLISFNLFNIELIKLSNFGAISFSFSKSNVKPLGLLSSI